jgi:hypothetical protein
MKQRAFRAPSAESKNTAPVAISTVKKSQPNLAEKLAGLRPEAQFGLAI